MSELKKWSDEAVQQLLDIVGGADPVSAEVVINAADALETTTRRVSSKLRKMGLEVESLAQSKESQFSAEECEALVDFLTKANGELTYKEVAEQFMDGKFRPKQIQGKVLSLELTKHIKPAEKLVVAKEYTPDEEALFIKLANEGKFIEDIAAALGKRVPSARGKALSLVNKGLINRIPAQNTSNAKDKEDPYAALGVGIAEMTVAEIAEAVDKTERGVKTTLTRRGIKVADYDGKAKKDKAEAKLPVEDSDVV